MSDSSRAPSAGRRFSRPGARHQPSSHGQAVPKANVGDVADLRVVQITEIGAFLDWGHPRDLLLPLNEQRLKPAVGRRVLVMITTDREGRPVASQRLERFVADTSDRHGVGDKVVLMIGETSDLGVKAVVDNRCWGLLYHDDLSRPLRRGQCLTGLYKASA